MIESSKLRTLISTACKRLRRERNITQAQLAERCGISRPRISEIERGDTDIRSETIDRLVAAFGVTAAGLVAYGQIPAKETGVDERSDVR